MEVQFWHWVNLQKCLKYDSLRLEHDDADKQQLLEKLQKAQVEYYRHQLHIRELVGKKSIRKEMVEDLRKFLGDHYSYVELFVHLLRNSPESVELLVSLIPSNVAHLDLLAESFAFSFFQDLMHIEHTELELLKVIKKLMWSEAEKFNSPSDIFNENVSAVLGKILTLYTKHRSQRKYLNLLFRKPLIKIVSESKPQDLQLDSRKIYHRMMDKQLRARKSAESAIRSSFFRRKPTNPSVVDEYSELENYIEHPEVQRQVEELNDKIIGTCKLLLKSIYENVNRMPHGVRWLCKCIAELAEENGQKDEVDRNSLLGTFLFTKWWLPALTSADYNGLLENCLIPKTVRKNLVQISNVMKHVFQEKHFNEPEYSRINAFIDDEIPMMRHYFETILTMDPLEDMRRLRKQSVHVKSFIDIEHDEKNGNTMQYYYMKSLDRKQVPRIRDPLASRSFLQDSFKDFQVQGVLLSVNELRLLVKVVTDNEDKFLDANQHALVNVTKCISRAMEKDRLLLGVDTPGSLCDHYMLFVHTDMPAYMDRKSRKEKPKEIKQAKFEKLKQATRDLLNSLDSVAIFFENEQKSSLLDIVDFVLKFSYLFDSIRTTAKEQVPIKLVAQYLKTHLPRLPKDFREHNYAKLYNCLMEDHEQNYSTRSKVASRNKKILLLAVNSIEHHIIDIQKEAREQFHFQRTRDFIEILRHETLPVCICPQQSKQVGDILVTKQKDCFHTRLDYVNVLIPRPKSIAKSRSASKVNLTIEDTGHVENIDGFAKEFGSLESVRKSLEDENRAEVTGAAFFAYLEIVKEHLMTNSNLVNKTSDIEGLMLEIERYITAKLEAEIFPLWPTYEDTRLYSKTLELDWLMPEHLDIPQDQRHAEMWTFAIDSLQEIDEYRSTVDKLQCLVEFISTIIDILHLCADAEAVGADESLPIVIYLIIRAQPKRLHSNLNFISQFSNKSKMLADFGFCHSLISAGMEFVITSDATSFSLDPNEYHRNIERARRVHNLFN
mmetsp:Transcript_10623/g.20548  ORF Transcript_10623/g.20548 Transcript_10623/m.20548 type:complete len:1002 (+) Transcript_10623:440-3445(+)